MGRKRLPYYEICRINEDNLEFDLYLFWPVNRKDAKGVAYESFDSIRIEWTLTWDADYDEGRYVDCSELIPKFSDSCSKVKNFYATSPFHDLKLKNASAGYMDNLNAAIEYVKELVDEKIKTIKPMRCLVQKMILTCSDNFKRWNPDYRKKVEICGFKLTHYKDGEIGSSDTTCYELNVKKKLTKKEISELEKAGVRNGGVFEKFPPSVTETKKGYHYFWRYCHSTN